MLFRLFTIIKLAKTPLCFLLSLLVLGGCMEGGDSDPKALTAGGRNPFANSESADIKWPESKLSSGLSLRVAQTFLDDMPAKYNDGTNPNIIQEMRQKWEESSGDHTFFKTDLSTVSNLNHGDLSDFQDDEMGIYRSDSWFPDVGSSSLAVTQFFGTRKNTGTPFEYIEISHADIIVNYRDFTFVWDNAEDGNFGEYDLPSIILHELGHFLGLRHENDDISVMRPTLSSFHRYRDVYDADEQAIQDLYNVSSGSQSLSTQSSINTTSDREGEPVRGIIELKANGNCEHSINGKRVLVH